MLSPYIKSVSKKRVTPQYLGLILSLILLIGPALIASSSGTPRRLSIRSSSSVFAPTPLPQKQPFNQEMFGMYFLRGRGFTSKLIIHNQRIDTPITVTPVLLVDKGREITLDQITVAANRSLTVDINQALNVRREKNVKSGGLVLRYSFYETGAIDATVIINHPRDKLSLMSPVMAQAEYMSNAQEGVFWIPDKQTGAFIAVQNTSSQPRLVRPTLFVSGRQIRLSKITLAPRETTFIDLKSSLSNITDNAAGAIRLVNDGNPGDVMAEGGLVNHTTGFSKRISFMDPSLHFYDNTLRANFLFLGEPPVELGFPSRVSFRAACALHNTSAVRVKVRPVVKYLDGSALRQVRLPDITLKSRRVALIDLFEAQRNGAIPEDFRTGTLELNIDGPDGSVIAELTNLDVGGGYVLGSSFSGHPSRGVGGTFWRIDGDWQSIITLTNAATTEDDISVELFYEGGSYRLPMITVAGGGIAFINLKELQNRGMPDAQGNLLPVTATSGSFCVKGSNELHSAISMERLIFNSLTSECVVIDGTNDHYVTSIALQAGQPSSPVPQDTEAKNIQVSLPLITIARWNDGSFSNQTFEASYSSNNTAFATVSGPLAKVFINTDSIAASAQVKSVLTGYGCARGSFASVQILFTVGERLSAYVNVGTENNRCLWTKTCDGKCTVERYTTNSLNGRCFTPPNGFRQCVDMVAGGFCVLHRVICVGLSAPGICTNDED